MTARSVTLTERLHEAEADDRLGRIPDGADWPASAPPVVAASWAGR
jgi:hypothetical protein